MKTYICAGVVLYSVHIYVCLNHGFEMYALGVLL